jgi:hypothetical protein
MSIIIWATYVLSGIFRACFHSTWFLDIILESAKEPSDHHKKQKNWLLIKRNKENLIIL